MFDVERPREFDAGRPESSYFVFGGAPRECLGKELISSLFSPLLRGLALHRPEIFEARPGRFRFDGATLAGYTLRLPERAPLTLAPRTRRVAPPAARPVYALEPVEALPPMAAESAALYSEPERPSRLPDPVN
jgi:hypothetical protein